MSFMYCRRPLLCPVAGQFEAEAPRELAFSRTAFPYYHINFGDLYSARRIATRTCRHIAPSFTACFDLCAYIAFTIANVAGAVMHDMPLLCSSRMAWHWIQSIFTTAVADAKSSLSRIARSTTLEIPAPVICLSKVIIRCINTFVYHLLAVVSVYDAKS